MYKKDIVNELSPAFDNGTSMGYQILDENIDKQLSNIENYVNKGSHHIKWKQNDAKNAGHFELLEKMVETFPEIKDVIKSKLSIDISKLQDDISELQKFEISDERYKLSDKRADFIMKLIEYKFEKLKKMFA